VLVATTHDRFESARDALRHLASSIPVWIAGAGATPNFATDTGAHLLDVDPLAAAERVAAALRA
jgi:hypothetical protein